MPAEEAMLRELIRSYCHWADKRAIEDHFDNNQELELALRAKGKDEQADRSGIFSPREWNVFLCASPSS
jgi:UTP-glucose-1-phosphate uridylyltransferase